jgi:hypothetical protein
MLFAERMRGMFRKGVAGSRKLADGIGATVNDLGNKGAMKIEIAALKSREGRLMEKIGGEAYSTLVEMDRASLRRDTNPIRGLLDSVTALRASIAAIEAPEVGR